MKHWEVLTMGGKVPVVREVKQPHGEAPCFHSTIVEVGGPPYRTVGNVNFGYGRKENREHALLMAAAPELFEVLKALWHAVAKYDIGHEGSELLEVMSDAREAIAKAEGK